MRTPGYTADAALDRTGTPYRSVVNVVQAGGAVLPTFVARTCYSNCLADQGDDPFANTNCRCICFGHPGRTCWLI